MEIGEPLLGTKFNVTENGELLIGGSRRCFINGKLSGDWLSTGDIVELTELGKIYWYDRSDDQVRVIISETLLFLKSSIDSSNFFMEFQSS